MRSAAFDWSCAEGRRYFFTSRGRLPIDVVGPLGMLLFFAFDDDGPGLTLRLAEITTGQ
jgi:hypothetical protein